MKIDLKGMEASTNCFFVVVGGKYLRLMDKVMDIVDKVTEDVGRRPLAIFYVTKDEKITSYYDQPFHLPLVINLIFIIFHINPNRRDFRVEIKCGGHNVKNQKRLIFWKFTYNEVGKVKICISDHSTNFFMEK